MAQSAAYKDIFPSHIDPVYLIPDPAGRYNILVYPPSGESIRVTEECYHKFVEDELKNAPKPIEEMIPDSVNEFKTEEPL